MMFFRAGCAGRRETHLIDEKDPECELGDPGDVIAIRKGEAEEISGCERQVQEKRAVGELELLIRELASCEMLQAIQEVDRLADCGV